MNMAASSAPFSPPVISLFFKPQAACLVTSRNSFSPLHAPKLTSPSTQRRSCFLHLPEAVWPKPTRSWKLSATHGNFLLLEASPVQTSEEIVSTSDGGGTNVVSALFFIAFICLSILTIGVIYIAVTDFLQKRERDKFEKEEAAKKKKSGKKGKVRARARAGPRGFGQKIEEDDDIDAVD